MHGQKGDPDHQRPQAELEGATVWGMVAHEDQGDAF
jgi:hypothetical protein